MDLVSIRRQNIAWSIEQNPVEIIVHRTEKLEVDGHFGDHKSILGPFTVRVFQKANRDPKDISTLAGTKEVGASWGLLADENADLKSGPNVKDEFVVEDLGSFTVVEVFPQIVNGRVIGYQADLERVK